MLGAVLICSNWLVALLPPLGLLCDVSMLTVQSVLCSFVLRSVHDLVSWLTAVLP